MNNVRKVLLDELGNIEENEVALLLSGGNGSASVLFALLELGKKVHAYTFHIEGHASTDLIKAKELCEKHNIRHTLIPLKHDLKTLKNDCLKLINEIGCRLKTDVECCYAYLNVLPHIK